MMFYLSFLETHKLAMLTLLPTFMLIYSLFVPIDVSKYEIGNQGVYENYISRIQISLDELILNDTAKTKSAMLAFLYCREFVKNSPTDNIVLDSSP